MDRVMNAIVLPRDASIACIAPFGADRRMALPLFMARVAAGFPSPADDYIDQGLDLNELLVRRPAATFFVRVAGDSMTGAGITSGDILVVDRAEEVRHGSIIIAALDGELTVKRFLRERDCVSLAAENPDYPPIRVTAERAFEVWGVVVHVIHSFDQAVVPFRRP